MPNSINDTENKSKKKSALSKLLEFDIKIKEGEIPRLIPLIIFITSLALIYIAKNIYSNKVLLERTKMKTEIKDLRAEYLKNQEEYMKMTRLSEISDTTRLAGLKELTEPQKKIIVKDGEY